MAGKLHTFRGSFKAFDIVVYGCVAFLIAAMSLTVYAAPTTSDPVVHIRARARSWIFPIDHDRVVQPLVAEGTCRIAIERGAVRVVASDCPQRICMTMGAISSPNRWIACLPHDLFIVVRGDAVRSRVDGVAF